MKKIRHGLGEKDSKISLIKGWIFLEPNELDVARLLDGRDVTILESFNDGADFYVE